MSSGFCVLQNKTVYNTLILEYSANVKANSNTFLILCIDSFNQISNGSFRLGKSRK